MRILTALGAIAVVLAPAAAGAQTVPTSGPQPISTMPTTSIRWVDFGARTTWENGEASRYERYRDYGDGASLNTFNLHRQKNDWFFSSWATDVARNDQRYVGSVIRPGRLKVYGLFDETPMLMSRVTQTMFVENISKSPGVFTIPDTVQSQMQPTTAPRPQIFDANNFAFTTDSRRRTGSGGFEFLATPDLTIRTAVSYIDRKGVLPYGGSFGHSSMVEMPAPILHTTTDVDSNAEYTFHNLLLRGGFLGSWFHNDVTQVEFDNPFQAADVAGTPSRGRLSLAQSNSFISANGMALLKLPRRTRASAYVSVGSLNDTGAPLMPQTINSVNLPLVVALPRNTVDGSARTTGVNLTFTSRPVNFWDFSARYRFYDYNNQTPEFVLPQRVSYDNAPGAATFSTLGGVTPSPEVVETEPFGIKRHNLDADVRMKPGRLGSVGFGYSFLGEDRTHRFFESTSENVFRVTYDYIGIQTFSLRTKYEHGQKRGDVTDEARLELFNIGEQPDLRHFDLASRNRDRVTVVGTWMATGAIAINGSAAAGRDDYLESTFGLRDNKHQVYTGGVDAFASDKINFGVSYSYERYDALLHSRQASTVPSGATALTLAQFDNYVLPATPIPAQAVADLRYDWSNTGADRVHSFIASLDIMKIREKFDLRFSYDYNHARALYSYAIGSNIPLRTLPEDIDPGLPALPPPTALPLVKSDTQRGTFDGLYNLNARYAFGVSFWYEDYNVSDFQLDIDSTPELVRGSSLLLGYLYRPYVARTIWGRMIVRW